MSKIQCTERTWNPVVGYAKLPAACQNCYLTSPRNVILHADDDSAQRHLSRALFENWGFTVFGASSGEEAFKLFVKQHFDVVVLDYRMSGVTGVETASAIREVYPAIPIILYTSEVELPPHALRCVSRMVQKAGDPESLRDALLLLALPCM